MYNEFILPIPRAREEITILMERASHDAVSDVKRFLYPITMVYIDVNIKDSTVVFQKLQNAQYNVVHVAEPARLVLLCVVQAT